MITEFVSVVWSCRLLSGPSGSQYVYVELFVGFLLMVWDLAVIGMSNGFTFS